MRELAPYLSDQDGVVSRRQVHEAGIPPHRLERLLRQRLLAPLHAGVYVGHTGTPTPRQRIWGAVLLCRPTAAAGPTSLWLTDGMGHPPPTVHLVVPRGRHVDAPAGISVTRSDPLFAEVQWQARPPRVRYEAAAVHLAAVADDDLAAVGVLTQVVGTRRTTPDRLAAALDRRHRLPRRAWLQAVLDDLRLGTHSVLEHGYLHRVERGHQLPTSQWQRRECVNGRSLYRDATYRLPAGDLIVELDGRAHHDAPRLRERDYERDLDVAADGRLTVRLTWAQVFTSPCRTAERVTRIVAQLGWSGGLQRCGPQCLA